MCIYPNFIPLLANRDHNGAPKSRFFGVVRRIRKGRTAGFSSMGPHHTSDATLFGNPIFFAEPAISWPLIAGRGSRPEPWRCSPSPCAAICSNTMLPRLRLTSAEQEVAVRILMGYLESDSSIVKTFMGQHGTFASSVCFASRAPVKTGHLRTSGRRIGSSAYKKHPGDRGRPINKHARRHSSKPLFLFAQFPLFLTCFVPLSTKRARRPKAHSREHRSGIRHIPNPRRPCRQRLSARGPDRTASRARRSRF